MNMNQKIAVAVADVAVLVEMCVSVFMANGAGEDFTPIFFKLFFSMLLPTVFVAWIVVRKLRSENPELTA